MKKEVQAEKLAHKGFCGFSTRNAHETGGTGVPFLSMVHKKTEASPDTNSTNGSKASRWCAASASRVRKDSDVPVHSLVLRSTILVFVTEKNSWAFCVPENVQPKSGVSSAVGFKPSYGDIPSNMGSDGDLPAKWPI